MEDDISLNFPLTPEEEAEKVKEESAKQQNVKSGKWFGSKMSKKKSVIGNQRESDKSSLVFSVNSGSIRLSSIKQDESQDPSKRSTVVFDRDNSLVLENIVQNRLSELSVLTPVIDAKARKWKRIHILFSIILIVLAFYFMRFTNVCIDGLHEYEVDSTFLTFLNKICRFK
jgi:hypothetical protein